MTQHALITDLKARTKELIEQAESFQKSEVELLNQRPAPDAWSVLECIEHLNLYGDFYIPEVERVLLKARKVPASKTFKSGWFGERTVQSMLPKERGMIKMKAFKSKTPDHSSLSIRTIDRFLKQQQVMLQLLARSETTDLQGTLTKITLPIIKFYLGTTLRFVIYHNQRHMTQASRALRLAKGG